MLYRLITTYAAGKSQIGYRIVKNFDLDIVPTHQLGYNVGQTFVLECKTAFGPPDIRGNVDIRYRNMFATDGQLPGARVTSSLSVPDTPILPETRTTSGTSS